MKTISTKKLWKYLIWPGLFLVAAGLTIGVISERWGTVPLAFIISGVIVIGLWLIWQSQENNWWGRRSTQAGTNALVASLAVLAILGLINFFASRYEFRADLTETKLFTLAPESKELVQNLKQPVKVWVFDVTQNPQDRELLESYQKQNSQFKFEYADPQAKPGLTEKFGVKDFGEVYLESGEKKQLVQVVNVSDRLSEIKLTNSLQQISSTSTTKVYFLQGHGEHQLSAGEGAIFQASQALSNKNYTTAPLNLISQSTVPSDANVLVVAGPKRELFDTEVKALQNYLNQGGNLVLMIDQGTDPKIDSLLTQWGVKLDNRLAIDVSGNVSLGPAVPIVTEYGQHPITKDFGNGISFYRLARPVNTTPVPDVEATKLLITKPYPNTWAESDLNNENLEFNEGKDLKGPLTLGVALTRKLPASTKATPSPTPTISPEAETKPSPTPSTSVSPSVSPSPTPSNSTVTESRMVVIGDSDFATDNSFTQQLNGDVFLNSVNWASQQDRQPLSIRPKEAKNRRINLTGLQANILAVSSLLILPLIGFAVAVLLWWLRR
ncbi:MAG: Gldg family protein [Pelatocladus maniniholoensis HA4357-MV3]|uniref:Gldg family protein n=1 Tax=Pelatocladus maniniholoensis HA4357-MV3 TaxID=1117104 RepID=A0A9E3HAA3_9NOST|nr:Gldg family protein [Pelatocladus maniniholoensis HA4357-MV3]